MRSNLALASLTVLGLAAPALAQTNTPQFDELRREYRDAFNRKDAAGAAALYTPDATVATPDGVLHGRAAIQKWQEDGYKAGLHDMANPIIATNVTNSMAWAVGEFSIQAPGASGEQQTVRGYWGGVYVPEGNSWKIQELTINLASPSAPSGAQR
jgi:ketosteroid isomerase-like protein